MSKILHHVKFTGIDDRAGDDALSISLTKLGNTLICVSRGSDVIFHATIPKIDWIEMLTRFNEAENGEAETVKD